MRRSRKGSAKHDGTHRRGPYSCRHRLLVLLFNQSITCCVYLGGDQRPDGVLLVEDGVIANDHGVRLDILGQTFGCRRRQLQPHSSSAPSQPPHRHRRDRDRAFPHPLPPPKPPEVASNVLGVYMARHGEPCRRLGSVGSGSAECRLPWKSGIACSTFFSAVKEYTVFIQNESGLVKAIGRSSPTNAMARNKGTRHDVVYR